MKSVRTFSGAHYCHVDPRSLAIVRLGNPEHCSESDSGLGDGWRSLRARAAAVPRQRKTCLVFLAGHMCYGDGLLHCTKQAQRRLSPRWVPLQGAQGSALSTLCARSGHSHSPLELPPRSSTAHWNLLLQVSAFKAFSSYSCCFSPGLGLTGCLPAALSHVLGGGFLL